ncbi:MAG: F0F1 ATP synthase subunit B [Legionellales bacterium]|nr:F0F1 ATP synthase subunit B [Legionellales bacterium]|tara:strand:- start:808 stop:1278 length:471 start_codon:yes stop_codon:yes gene_type:complete
MNINATLIGQSIAFIMFIWFTMKFVWPLLLTAMEERQARIADGLAAGEQGQKDFAEAQEKSNIEINKGKEKAATIISQAQKRGDEIVEEARDLAKKESERIKESAISEIEQEKETARQDLRNQVAVLAITGAEQILMREVDQKAHNEVLTKISREL